MLEHKVKTGRYKMEANFVLREPEKHDEHHGFREEIDEETKELLENPADLRFNELAWDKILSSKSNRGQVGLSNLGNTCFMNSALQCLSNCEPLTKYFLCNLHKREINSRNVMGSKGRVAEAFGRLLEEMWVESRSRIAPSSLKSAIGEVAHQFRGYAQQDSYELFNYLIDTIHEDLNRIRDKPYIEQTDSNGRDDQIVSEEHWGQFMQRNRSVIVDLFYGQYKSKLTC